VCHLRHDYGRALIHIGQRLRTPNLKVKALS
jgi:hypothetical protein